MSIPNPDIPPRTRRSAWSAAGASPTALPQPTPPEETPQDQTAKVANKKRPLRTVDILLSVPEELKQRMVNTILWTAPRTGVQHQQKFIRQGIEELCARYEAEYNAGANFSVPEDEAVRSSATTNCWRLPVDSRVCGFTA